jgi:Flp pilus assembly protein TadB
MRSPARINLLIFMLQPAKAKYRTNSIKSNSIRKEAGFKMKITRDVIKRGFKFSLTALIIYFCLKTPIMWFLTDILHIHYILSGAISGIIVTVLMFIPSEFWVFKQKVGKVVL